MYDFLIMSGCLGPTRVNEGVGVEEWTTPTDGRMWVVPVSKVGRNGYFLEVVHPDPSQKNSMSTLMSFTLSNSRPVGHCLCLEETVSRFGRHVQYP